MSSRSCNSSARIVSPSQSDRVRSGQGLADVLQKARTSQHLQTSQRLLSLNLGLLLLLCLNRSPHLLWALLGLTLPDLAQVPSPGRLCFGLLGHKRPAAHRWTLGRLTLVVRPPSWIISSLKEGTLWLVRIRWPHRAPSVQLWTLPWKHAGRPKLYRLRPFSWSIPSRTRKSKSKATNTDSVAERHRAFPRQWLRGANTQERFPRFGLPFVKWV